MTAPVPPVEYRTTDITGIEVIRPLWAGLNAHHRAHARAFKDLYARMTFDDRKAYFAGLAEAGALRIDLAFDPAAVSCVGYCVSSLSPESAGEIESVYVDEAYRSQGVGTALVHRALAWLDGNGSAVNRVSVTDGNEEAFSFYRRFGFHPRRTVLEQRRE
ncbi:MAG TPA: GNAT family N-acetyltransferase [Methanoculleus sp.]|nr:GNAT family N-acetyltransferase [Methanoculleus sp.]